MARAAVAVVELAVPLALAVLAVSLSVADPAPAVLALAASRVRARPAVLRRARAERFRAAVSAEAALAAAQQLLWEARHRPALLGRVLGAPVASSSDPSSCALGVAHSADSRAGWLVLALASLLVRRRRAVQAGRRAAARFR